MSEDNAKNHANFADAFSMTARAIKIDKRLPFFFGGRAGNVKLDRLRALKPDLQPIRSRSAFFRASHLPYMRRSQLG